jgi:hypothetical protein
MGDAGIEPDIERVGDFVVVLRIRAQQFARVQFEPGVDALGFDAPRDLLDQVGGVGMQRRAAW